MLFSDDVEDDLFNSSSSDCASDCECSLQDLKSIRVLANSFSDSEFKNLFHISKTVFSKILG